MIYLKKIKDEWNSRDTFSKILLVVSLILSITVFILAFIDLFNIVDKDLGYYYLPCMALFIIIQGIENLKKDKLLAMISFGAGIFILLIVFIRILSL